MNEHAETEFRVNGKTGHLVMTSTIDLRSLLENKLHGFVDPRWQDTEDSDGATGSLAQTISSVPQIAQAILSHMIYGCTEDGDSFNDAVLLELRRRVAAGMGPEGETTKDLAESLQKANGTIETLYEERRNLRFDMERTQEALRGSEAGRKAANSALAEVRIQLADAQMEIRRLTPLAQA
jgi:hypothetical protein